MGGRYLLSDERGPRGVFTSEQNEKMKKKKRNKTKILSVVIVLGCKVV